MNRLLRLTLPLVTSAAMLTLAGCGDKDKGGKSGASSGGTKSAATNSDGTQGGKSANRGKSANGKGKQAGANSTGAVTAPPPAADPSESAEATVIAVVEGLKSDDPAVVWDLMPASYQSDVNDLVHQFAKNMDPQLWRKMIGTIEKTSELFKNQKKFVLEHPQVKASSAGSSEHASEGYDKGVAMLSTFLDSDLADLEKLKTVDVGEQVRKTGGELFTQFVALAKLDPDSGFVQLQTALNNFKVQTVSQKGDAAEVEMTPIGLGGAPRKGEFGPDGEVKNEKTGEHPAHAAERVKFIRVEDKWVPKHVAETWDDDVADAKHFVNAMPEQLKKSKGIYILILSGFDSGLDELNNAETAEEFNAALDTHLATVGGMFGGAAAPPEADASDSDKNPSPKKRDSKSTPDADSNSKSADPEDAAREPVPAPLPKGSPKDADNSTGKKTNPEAKPGADAEPKTSVKEKPADPDAKSPRPGADDESKAEDPTAPAEPESSR